MSERNDSNARVVALDDLVRRKLRVGDTKNAGEISKALLERYPEERVRFQRESAGFAVVEAEPVGRAEYLIVSPTESDFTQAKADLDQDLNILIAEPALRNVANGLRGWAQMVRSAVNEGVAAARLALDPAQRDKVFGVRRTLGDYARLARYVGVLNIESNFKYRRLARSIDHVSALIFVQMGEAIAKQAMSGFLMQVSLGEIQSRAAGVINSLRNLLGSVEAAYDDNTWGRGRVGYEALHRQIGIRNQPDLRVLLQEAELSRAMNELIDLAGRNSAEGLAALGATAGVVVEKLQRLLQIGDAVVAEGCTQPPLVAFLAALRLFVGAYAGNRVGLRLVDIARPPIAFYGSRTGNATAGDDSDARTRLVQLAFARGKLAEALDDYLRDDLSEFRIIAQITLDKMLFDVDRTIDLYAQGTSNWGPAEKRAVAYALLLASLCGTKVQNLPDKVMDETDMTERRAVVNSPPSPEVPPDPAPKRKKVSELIDDRKPVKEALKKIIEQLAPPSLDKEGKDVKYAELIQEFSTELDAEERWKQLVQAVVPSNFP